jgi:hypothetical protein
MDSCQEAEKYWRHMLGLTLEALARPCSDVCQALDVAVVERVGVAFENFKIIQHPTTP